MFYNDMNMKKPDSTVTIGLLFFLKDSIYFAIKYVTVVSGK